MFWELCIVHVDIYFCLHGGTCPTSVWNGHLVMIKGVDKNYTSERWKTSRKDNVFAHTQLREKKSSLAYFLRTHILSLISFFLKPFPLGSVVIIVNQTCECLISTSVSQVKWFISWKLSCVLATLTALLYKCAIKINFCLLFMLLIQWLDVKTLA